MPFEDEVPEGWRPGDRLFGAAAKPSKFKCGGWTECDEDHAFLAPQDILALHEALPLDMFRDEEHGWRQDLEDKAVGNHTLFIGNKVVVPTVLGMWFEAASVN